MGSLFLSQANPFVPESLELFAVVQKGGPLMWLILLGSIVGIVVFIDKLLYFRRSEMGVEGFLLGINTLLSRGKFQEAIEQCHDGKGPVARVVLQAIEARKLPPVELREVVKEVAQMQLPRLEANLSILSTLGYVMPLIGLLGTVTGMIDAFIEINRAAGAASVSDIASGIWTALITTAAGLAVAIPCDVGYSYLLSRLNQIISDMERAGIEVIHVLTQVHRPPQAEEKTQTAVVPDGNLTLLPPEEVIPNPVLAAKKQVT